MVYVVSLNLKLIYLTSEAYIAFLLIEKIIISAKYLKFVNIFSKELVLGLPEYLGINEYAINLKEGKQLLYKSIYNPSLIRLKSFKTYIKLI